MDGERDEDKFRSLPENEECAAVFYQTGDSEWTCPFSIDRSLSGFLFLVTLFLIVTFFVFILFAGKLNMRSGFISGYFEEDS